MQQHQTILQPDHGTRHTLLAPSAIRAKNPFNHTRTCNKLRTVRRSIVGSSPSSGTRWRPKR